MAVIPWTTIQTPLDGRNLKLIRWVALNANDTGQPFVVGGFSDKTIQIDGATLGSGITIQGSIDPSELTSPDGGVVGAGWDTVNDPQGNALAGITTEKVETVLEHIYLLRPNCAAGVTSATVFLLLGSVR